LVKSLLSLPKTTLQTRVGHGELAAVLPVTVVVATEIIVARLVSTSTKSALASSIALRELSTDLRNARDSGVSGTVGDKVVDSALETKVRHLPSDLEGLHVDGRNIDSRETLGVKDRGNARKDDAVDAGALSGTAQLGITMGLATVEVIVVAIGITTGFTAVNDAATRRGIGVLRDVSSADADTSEAVSIEPDTARVVNVSVVPVALNGVTANLRIDVVGLDSDGANTPILDLEGLIVDGSVIDVNVASTVLVVQVPVIVRDLVTIAESVASNLGTADLRR